MSRNMLPIDVITNAEDITSYYVKQRLLRHGRGAFASLHETLGIVKEEYDEFSEEVHQNNFHNCRKELIDIAVACIIGVASIDLQLAKGETNHG